MMRKLIEASLAKPPSRKRILNEHFEPNTGVNGMPGIQTNVPPDAIENRPKKKPTIDELFGESSSASQGSASSAKRPKATPKTPRARKPPAERKAKESSSKPRKGNDKRENCTMSDLFGDNLDLPSSSKGHRGEGSAVSIGSREISLNSLLERGKEYLSNNALACTSIGRSVEFTPVTQHTTEYNSTCTSSAFSSSKVLLPVRSKTSAEATVATNTKLTVQTAAYMRPTRASSIKVISPRPRPQKSSQSSAPLLPVKMLQKSQSSKFSMNHMLSITPEPVAPRPAPIRRRRSAQIFTFQNNPETNRFGFPSPSSSSRSSSSSPSGSSLSIPSPSRRSSLPPQFRVPRYQTPAGYEYVDLVGSTFSHLYPPSYPWKIGRPFVLLYCSDLNPTTMEDLRVLEFARDHLQQEKGCVVLEGFLCPAADRDEKEWASGEHRMNMAELAAEEIDWIEVDDWWMKKKGSILELVKGFRSNVERCYGKDVGVAVVIHANQLQFSVEHHFPRGQAGEVLLELAKTGLILVETDHFDVYPTIRMFSQLDELFSDILIIQDPLYSSFGSPAQVRSFIRRGKSFRYTMPDVVYSYIAFNGLYLPASTLPSAEEQEEQFSLDIASVMAHVVGKVVWSQVHEYCSVTPGTKTKPAVLKKFFGVSISDEEAEYFDERSKFSEIDEIRKILGFCDKPAQVDFAIL